MAPLKIPHIRCGQEDAPARLTTLRNLLGAQGNVVSERGRQLTLKVFGEALPPVRVVERICEDLRTRGLPALLHYTEQFDNVRLTSETIRVSSEEMTNAHAAADPAFLETIRRIRKNILAFHLGILHQDAVLALADRHHLCLRYRPMRRVGVMVPGGAAAYPSTLLMTVIPAQAAGVSEIAVVMPPTPQGAYNRDQLAVCQELGITEVYRVGGAQAVAALAYGVEGLPAVDMIVGPGNLFVALAKRHVFGQVNIDCIAGPSEVIVLADDTASPDFIAADLLAQAEHAPGSAILITWHEPLLQAVQNALEEQLALLERSEVTRDGLERYSALVLARNAREGVAITNLLAPEHLHIATHNSRELSNQIDNAGAIFLGPYTPVALGDYAAGPSHVLPTGGTARFTSGLSANDFLRRSSVLDFTAQGLLDIAPDVCLLATREGLTAHRASVEIRLEALKKNSPPCSNSSDPASAK